jgi:hypothetical protein
MQHKYKQSWLFQDNQGCQGKYSHSYCHRHFANESKPGGISLVTLSENLGTNAIKHIAVTPLQHKYKQSYFFKTPKVAMLSTATVTVTAILPLKAGLEALT